MKREFESASQAIEWINGLRYAGEKNGLSNMRALLGRLGNPERALKMVHVAGTNGKGSTCAMLEKMLRGCGLKTGLYTSPYLMRFEERMRVNGAPIEGDALRRIASRVREATDALLSENIKPTTFELGTAVTLCYFAEEQVDVAIIEVGLGGRLDPTNVILPEVCLIAPIGKDHIKVLGDTLEQIAGEKAGIIKEHVPVAVAPQQTESIEAVFREAAAEKRAPLMQLHSTDIEILHADARGAEFIYHGMKARIALSGRHQVDNACLALSGLELLRGRGFDLPLDLALPALNQAVWPGRLEWLADNLLIDGAHNPHGARALAAYIREYLPGKKVVPVIGMMGDKDVEACVSIYAALSDAAVATQVDYPRAMPAEQLAALLKAHGVAAQHSPSLLGALEMARKLAGDEGVVLVCGSLYVVGAIRMALHADEGRL